MRFSSLDFKRSLRPSAGQTAPPPDALPCSTVEIDGPHSRRIISPERSLLLPGCFSFRGLEKTPSESPELQELAARVRSSLASITKTHSDEFAVRCLMRSRALFIIAGFFLATAACAQSLPDESDSLATALSDRAASIAPTAKLRPRLSATARTAPAPKSSAAVDSGKNPGSR